MAAKKSKTTAKKSVATSNSMGLLDSYEFISKGSSGKILALAKAEQEHRHKWENSYLKAMASNHRIGQLLVFILAIIIIYSSIAFVMVHDPVVALVVVLAGFSFLSILCIANSKSHKNILTKPKGSSTQYL